MAEFKVSEGLLAEITSFRTSGESINATYSSVSTDGVDTLSTATAYIEKLAEIKTLIDLYKSLVMKDATDLMEMYESVQNTDKMLADGFK